MWWELGKQEFQIRASLSSRRGWGLGWFWMRTEENEISKDSGSLMDWIETWDIQKGARLSPKGLMLDSGRTGRRLGSEIPHNSCFRKHSSSRRMRSASNIWSNWNSHILLPHWKPLWQNLVNTYMWWPRNSTPGYLPKDMDRDIICDIQNWGETLMELISRHTFM